MFSLIIRMTKSTYGIFSEKRNTARDRRRKSGGGCRRQEYAWSRSGRMLNLSVEASLLAAVRNLGGPYNVTVSCYVPIDGRCLFISAFSF